MAFDASEVQELNPDGAPITPAAATPAPTQASGSPTHPMRAFSHDEVIEDNPSTAPTPSTAAPPPVVSDGSNNWNAGVETANAGLLGGGKKLMAWIQSLKPGAPDDAYQQALEHYNLKQGDYQKENPITSRVADIAGGSVPMAGAMLAGAPLLGAATPAVAGGLTSGTSSLINDPTDLKTAAEQTALGAGTGYLFGKAAEAPNLVSKTLVGVGAGGASGATQGALNTPDGSDWKDYAHNMAVSGGEGAALGMIPAVSSVAGKVVENVANKTGDTKIPGYSPESQKTMREDTQTTNSPEIQTALQKLGSEAILPDVSTAAQGSVSGAAKKGGQAYQDTSDFLKNRAVNTNVRVGQDIDSAMGPLTETQNQAARSLIDQQAQIGEQEFKPLLRNAAPIDPNSVKPIIDNIQTMRDNTAQGTSQNKALAQFQNMLQESGGQPATPAVPPTRVPVTDPVTGKVIRYDLQGGSPGSPATGPTPLTDPAKLHSIKQEIDKVINYGDSDLKIPRGGDAVTQQNLGTIRQGLNTALRGDGTPANPGVPGYSDIMDKYSDLYKKREALNYGYNALTNPVEPRDFQAAVAKFGPDALDSLQTGMRYRMAKVKDNAINDANGLNQTIKGTTDGQDPANQVRSWNSQNIANTFGQNAADTLDNTVLRERTFADTKQRLVDNSQTHFRDQAEKRVDANAPVDKPFINKDWHDMSIIGGPLQLGINGINQVAKAFQKPANAPGYYNDLVKAYVGNHGQNAQNLYAQILKAGNNLSNNHATSQAMIRALTYGAGMPSVLPQTPSSPLPVYPQSRYPKSFQ